MRKITCDEVRSLKYELKALIHNEKNHDVTDKDFYLKLFIIKTNPNVQSTMADLCSRRRNVVTSSDTAEVACR